MLNYVMNVCYYLVMKAEGKSIAQHPVVQHLVEMRVYMEKMNPLENKLKYQIDKLLRTASKGEAAGEDDVMQLEGEEEEEEDAMSFRPNLSGMATKAKGEVDKKKQRNAEPDKRGNYGDMNRLNYRHQNNTGDNEL